MIMNNHTVVGICRTKIFAQVASYLNINFGDFIFEISVFINILLITNCDITDCGLITSIQHHVILRNFILLVLCIGYVLIK